MNNDKNNTNRDYCWKQARNLRDDYLELGLDSVKSKIVNANPEVRYRLCQLAIYDNEQELLKYILKAKLVDINAEMDCGTYTSTLFTDAILDEQLGCAQILLQHGVDIDYQPKVGNGFTPLMDAVFDNKPYTVAFLLDNKANIEIQERGMLKRTALHIAATEAGTEIIEMLVKVGANLEARDSNNRTPLIYAADDGKLANVKMLVELGADRDAEDKYGKTALDHARDENRLKVAAFLSSSSEEDEIVRRYRKEQKDREQDAEDYDSDYL